MRRFLTIVSILFAAFTLNAQVISISSNMPNKAVAGQKIRIILSIQKNNLLGFAKFTQNLPAGFTAIEDSGQTAEFHFDKQNLELVWLRLPKTDIFTTSYTIKVADTLKGQFIFKGQFSYLYKNKMAISELQGHQLAIETLNQYFALGGRQEDLTNLVFIPEGIRIPMVECIREKKQVDSAKHELQIKLIVDNKNHTQTARLIEKIPVECKAVIDSKGGAKIQLSSQQIAFDWDKLPLGKTIITYRLIPKTSNAIVLSGFSGNLNLQTTYGTQKITVFDANSGFYVLNNVLPTNVYSNEAVAVAEKKATQKKRVSFETKKMVASVSNTALAGKLAKSLKKGSAVHYRIQIAAFSKPVSNAYFKKIGLKQAINKEQHSGLYKYTVGDFKTYAEARDFKQKMLKSTNLKSAFITAYKRHNRIEIQKALKKTGK